MSNIQLGTDDLKFLESHAKKINLPAQYFVFRDGDECTKFLFVISGSVRVQKLSESGRQVTLYRVAEGGMCILTTSCLLGNLKYNAEGVTEVDTVALTLSSIQFRELMHQSESFREAVFRSMASRMSSLILKIDEIAFGQINQRIAATLQRLARNGVVEKTHQEIADEIGSAREVVSRHLKEFEKKGLIEIQRQHIRLNADSFSAIFDNL